jgi:hypothetical protein
MTKQLQHCLRRLLHLDAAVSGPVIVAAAAAAAAAAMKTRCLLHVRERQFTCASRMRVQYMLDFAGSKH